MISDDTNRGTVSRKKYPFLKLADRATAEACNMDIRKLQRQMDEDALKEHLEKKYQLRAEELAQVCAETNCQGGTESGDTVPIPGSRPPSSGRD